MQINTVELQQIADSLNELRPETIATVATNGTLYGNLNGFQFALSVATHSPRLLTLTHDGTVKTLHTEAYACIAVAKEILGNAAYKIVDGTYYSANTSDEVIRILEHSRRTGIRLRLHYGDVKTGTDWMNEWDVTGKIGRSMGPVRIPLMIASGKDGGPGLLENCIVRIREASSNRDLYRIEGYQQGIATTANDSALFPKLPYAALVNGETHARFATAEKRSKWFAKMGIAEPAHA